MYKFTNGLVFFDKKEADNAIRAGYKLVEEKKQPKEEIINEINEDTNKSISESNQESNKPVRKSRKSL